MKIIRHTSMVVEKLVVLAECGEPDLIKLLDPNLPEHEGWTLDWYRGNKFVLRRHRDCAVLVGSKKKAGMMLDKWSDHTFDICPYCGGHMGLFAPTYAFNFCFVGCPHCGGESQSAAIHDGGTTFQWIIPDIQANQIYSKAREMVREAIT